MKVTVGAAEALHQTLQHEAADESQGLRLARTAEGNFSLRVDNEREGDDIFEHAGRKILLVEPALAETLAESTVDVVASESGPQLALLGPDEGEKDAE